MLDALYADPRAVLADVFDLLLPPERDTVDEYALKHRRVLNRSGTALAQWSHDRAPYLVAPMRALTSQQYLTTCLVAPAGAGKSVLAENWLLHTVGQQPRDVLWYLQNDAALTAFVKERIRDLIREHPEEMESRISDDREDDTLHFKRFRGMTAEFLAANDGNFRAKHKPYIVLDEIDGYDPGLGNVKALADPRRATFGLLSMLLAISHADRARGYNPEKDWSDGIMSIFKDSTRCLWYWPCAVCGAVSSPAPFAERSMMLEWPRDDALDVIQREAHLLCPVNKCKISENRQIKKMNLAAFHSPWGGWIGEGQSIDQYGKVEGELKPSRTWGGFVTGTMSPVNLEGLGGMARNMAAAEREYAVSGDPKTLKEVTVKQVGYLFSTKGTVGTIEASTLAERAQNELQPLGVVPEGVRFLFCWFDVQVAHFEVLVRGFGVGAESWVIDKRRVPAETATDGTAWLALLQELITKRYPLATDPTRGMVCRAVGYDAQGAAGTTNRANEAWKTLRAAGKALKYGVIAGRDVWSVVPTQGAPSDKASRLVVVYPDNQRKDRNTSASGAVPWARFNANLFKDDLFGQLQKMLPGPDYVHIPKALRSESAPHVNFEQLVSEQRNQTTGRWKKPHQAIRNEMLDLMVGTHVLAHLHGLARINWSAPPPWAQAWDKNTTIVPMVDVQQTVTSAGQPSASPPRRTIGSIMKGDE